MIGGKKVVCICLGDFFIIFFIFVFFIFEFIIMFVLLLLVDIFILLFKGFILFCFRLWDFCFEIVDIFFFFFRIIEGIGVFMVDFEFFIIVCWEFLLLVMFWIDDVFGVDLKWFFVRVELEI